MAERKAASSATRLPAHVNRMLNSSELILFVLLTHRHDAGSAPSDSLRMRPWGYHLIVDLDGCSEQSITYEVHIKDMIRVLVSRIGMKAHGDCQMSHFAEHTPEAAGWTAVQLIETSSITAHFSDEGRDAYIDIFSCKEFDRPTVISVLREYMQPDSVKFREIQRDAKYQGEHDEAGNYF